MTVAMFDLDNTLIRGSSLFHLGRVLVRRGILGPQHLVRFAGAEARYVLTRTESASVRERVVSRALGLVVGRRQLDLIGVCRTAAADIIARHAVPEVIVELRRHQAAGHRTVLVTASPIELAVAIGLELGFSDVIGTRAEVIDGHFTGRLSGTVMHGAAKRAALEDLIGVDGFTGSSAYSDSLNDLPMLSLAAHPVAVNADPGLMELARALRWRVIRSDRLRRSSRTSLVARVAAGRKGRQSLREPISQA